MLENKNEKIKKIKIIKSPKTYFFFFLAVFFEDFFTAFFFAAFFFLAIKNHLFALF